MAISNHEYRWQDHVPRLGSVDTVVCAATAAILLVAVAATPAGTAVRPETMDRTAGIAAGPCIESTIGAADRHGGLDGSDA